MKQPNILLITTDQQRFDTVPPLAPPFMRTPHYEFLAREGIRFDSAYSQCPICVPARISIMSGKEPQKIGAVDNGQSRNHLGRENTLPSELRKLGYQTAAIGKMHFGPQRIRHGFEEMILPDDYYREMSRSGSLVQPMRHGMGQNEVHPAMATVPETMTLTAWITEKCVEYILERRDPTVPFFLWCSYAKPHPPFDPPEPYYSMYRNCNIPEAVRGDWRDSGDCPHDFVRHSQNWHYDIISPEIVKEMRAAYYGLITQIDYNMGRIFGALKDLDMLKDTLILYTSDHGEYLGDHGTSSKMFFHEQASHVPFVLRLPKNWEDRMPGKVISRAVTHADILPTLLSAAGGSVPEWSDGENLIAMARSEKSKEKRYIEGISPKNEGSWIAITDGQWKYIYHFEGAIEQLFDREKDPMDCKNLAGLAEYQEKKEELKSELLKRHVERQSEWVRNGKFVVNEVVMDTEEERRNNTLPGFHTEYFKADVRH